jgi:hypothetical protein
MTNENLLDQFASSALTALINKMPFYDEKGEYGKQLSADELRIIKKELTATAYEYASYMLIARQKSIEWLRENENSGALLNKKEG